MQYEDFKRTMLGVENISRYNVQLNELPRHAGVFCKRYFDRFHERNDASFRINMNLYKKYDENDEWIPNEYKVSGTLITPDGLYNTTHQELYKEAIMECARTPMSLFEHEKCGGLSGLDRLSRAAEGALYYRKLKLAIKEGTADKELLPCLYELTRLPDFNLDVKFERIDKYDRDSDGEVALFGRYKFTRAKENIVLPEYAWCPYDKNIALGLLNDQGFFCAAHPMFMSLQKCNGAWRILFHRRDITYCEAIIIGTAQSLSSANEKATAFLSELALGCVTSCNVQDPEVMWKVPTPQIQWLQFHDLSEPMMFEALDKAEARDWADIADGQYKEIFKKHVDRIYEDEYKASHTFNPTSVDFEI